MNTSSSRFWLCVTRHLVLVIAVWLVVATSAFSVEPESSRSSVVSDVESDVAQASDGQATAAGRLSQNAIESGLSREVEIAILDTWGIGIVGLRLTAGGHMLDFRYRVHDAVKAGPLHGSEIKPVLIDPVTKQEYAVPRPPKIGPLKQTRSAPIANRQYVVLFANRGDSIKPGGVVSIKLGALTIEHIVAQ